MTRKNDVGVDTQPYTETVTWPSKTNDMAQVLQALEAEMEVTTAEGYAGTLHLDHTSVQVKTDGYATKTNNLSATRSYPNLSDADVSSSPRASRTRARPSPWLMSSGARRSIQTARAHCDPLHRHRQLHWNQHQPICHRLHRDGQLHRRGGQDRL